MEIIHVTLLMNCAKHPDTDNAMAGNFWQRRLGHLSIAVISAARRALSVSSTFSAIPFQFASCVTPEAENETFCICDYYFLGFDNLLCADSDTTTAGSTCDSNGTDSNSDANADKDADINTNGYSFVYQYTYRNKYADTDANIYSNNYTDSHADTNTPFCLVNKF